MQDGGIRVFHIVVRRNRDDELFGRRNVDAFRFGLDGRRKVLVLVAADVVLQNSAKQIIRSVDIRGSV